MLFKYASLFFLSLFFSCIALVAGIIFYTSGQGSKPSQISKVDVQFLESDSLNYYWEYKPTQIIVDSPDWLLHEVKYTINDDGLHDSRNYEIEKSPDIFRILALGDSFTFGHFVNTEENWTELLEGMLNDPKCRERNVEVINLGMPGFDVNHLVERFKQKGVKYNPDLIVWFDSGTGFTRFNELLQPMIAECEDGLSKYTDLIRNNLPPYYCWDKSERKLLDSHERSFFDGKIEAYLNDFDNARSEADVHIFFQQMYEQKYESTVAVYKQKDFNLHFIISNFEHEESLPDNHPNQKGHQKIAQEIYDTLHICD